MIGRLLAELYGDARTASQIRRVLAGTTLGAAVLASAIAGVEHPVVLSVVILFTLVAVAQPAGNGAIGVIVIVIARWLATNDDPVTPSALGLAACLLTFHLCLALMAATPNSAEIERSVLRRWLLRGLSIMGATALVWGIVALLDRREAPASPVLAGAALLVVAVGAWSIRTRAVGDRA